MFQDLFRQHRHTYNSPLAFRLLHKHRILSHGRVKDRPSIYLEPLTSYYLEPGRIFSPYEPLAPLEQYKPSFTQRLRPRVIQENQPVKLSCLVDGKPSPNVTWYKGRTPLTGADPHYEIRYGHGICTLEIASCRPSDMGDYACRAENSSGMDETSAFLCVEARTRKAKDTAKLEPEEIPPERERRTERPSPEPKPKKRKEVTFAPHILEEIQGLTVYEGATVMLRCRIDGKPVPTVSWTRNGEQIVPDNRYEITNEYGTPTLILRGIKRSEEGEYVCSIENSVGKASTSADVVVKASPIFAQAEEAAEAEVAEGEEKMEEAAAPKEIAEDKEPVKAETARVVTFAEEPPKEVAEEPTTEVIEEAKVPPKCKFTKHLESLNLSEGGKMLLECVIEGVGDDSTVQWTRNGKVIPENPDFIRKKDGDRYSLEVAEMFPEDSGTFGIEVISDGRTCQSICSVIVQGEEDESADPKIDSFPASLTAEEGGSAVFDCKASGTQPIKATWFFNDAEIEEQADKYSLTATGTEFKMTIANVDSSDEGTYFLILSNDQSEVTMAFALQVVSA